MKPESFSITEEDKRAIQKWFGKLFGRAHFDTYNVTILYAEAGT
ncbi:hypothetical protein [Gracilibacillus lacisalsi]|nr:hypothetical protein [Gracilibacillus lacisalsi]